MKSAPGGSLSSADKWAVGPTRTIELLNLTVCTTVQTPLYTHQFPENPALVQTALIYHLARKVAATDRSRSVMRHIWVS